MKRSASLALGFIALAGLAAPATAQIDFSNELDQLHDAALGLAATSTNFQADLADAVRVHARVVALRTEDDPARGRCLMDHASLLLATGDLEGARVFAARAVAQAMSTGDVLTAADASATAALLAQQDGDFRAARVYRRNARSLALLPEVTAEQSAAIATRLYGESWKASTDGVSAVIDD